MGIFQIWCYKYIYIFIANYVKIKLDFDIGYWRRKWSEKLDKKIVVSNDVAIIGRIKLDSY